MLAPAKINLFLHITGKRNDGYHLLQSLFAFADYGDEIRIEESNNFSLAINGPFSDSILSEENLITKSVTALENHTGRRANCKIRLTKNIPVGAGLGGGSADAAATIKALIDFWDIKVPDKKIDNIALSLGADIPACLYNRPCFVEGIGEKIIPINSFPALPAILVYPNKGCSTTEIFDRYNLSPSKIITPPENLNDKQQLMEFLKKQKNDLTATAIDHIPEINNILDEIKNQKGCLISRMSGSGSTCFGLFETKEDSENAVQNIKKNNPGWWVQAVTIK